MGQRLFLPGERDKTHCDKLIEITQNYNLEQINETPTRQGRGLDLFFTSHPILVQRHTVCHQSALVTMIYFPLPHQLTDSKQETIKNSV